MIKIARFVLKIMARAIINKYQPRIVGITGSVGKTSAKDAISLVLSAKFKVRSTYKNYNNEIGLPLSILEAEAPGKSLKKWFRIFSKFLVLFIFKRKDYPEILVLEMGVDRPGDMDYLTSIVKPDVGVITAVYNAHLENFGKIEKIKKEKQLLIKNLKKNGLAVLNYDNEQTREMMTESEERIFSFGLAEEAEFKAQDVNFNLTFPQSTYQGLNFKLNHKGSLVPFHLPQAVGLTAVYACLAATAVALEFGFNLIETAEALKNFSLPKGRLNLLKGLNGSLLIDDTYNASPASTSLALDVLKKAEVSGRKIAVLGDMLELGEESELGHREIGRKVFETQVDKLIVVGSLAFYIAKEAEKLGYKSEKISYYNNSLEAADKLKQEAVPGDVFLIKGSQGARMEKISLVLLEDKEQAKNLLVRQEEEWQNK